MGQSDTRCAHPAVSGRTLRRKLGHQGQVVWFMNPDAIIRKTLRSNYSCTAVYKDEYAYAAFTLPSLDITYLYLCCTVS